MSIIIYTIQILNIIKDSFKKLHMKSLRFASTKRIWKAIFIEETRRNVLRLCENFGFLRWKSIYKVYFLGRNAHSWFFTKCFTSRFFQAELRPFDDQRNRRLTENVAWFGSIQGLEINAQTWRLDGAVAHHKLESFWPCREGNRESRSTQNEQLHSQTNRCKL